MPFQPEDEVAEQVAEPLRPVRHVAEPNSEPAEPAGPAGPVTRDTGIAFTTRTNGPNRLRVGVVTGAAVALAVGAVATSLAATPSPSATDTTGATQSEPGLLAPLGASSAFDDLVAGFDHGQFGGPGGFGGITISAISGSSITLTTDDGWTRTIAITDSTELSRGGQDIALSDLEVGDSVRFRQTRNDDGTYTVTAIAVVVPTIVGTVKDVTASGFTVTTRDGSVWTITVDASTVYHYGSADGSKADVVAGAPVRVQGESAGDNALSATSVTVAGDHAIGTVTAKTADTITVQTRDGGTRTIHVNADTQYRVAGVDDADLGDVAVDMVVKVEGRARDDGSIDASVVAAGDGRLGKDGLRGFGGGGPGRFPGAWPGSETEPDTTQDSTS